jgi:hypothetical protein
MNKAPSPIPIRTTAENRKRTPNSSSAGAKSARENARPDSVIETLSACIEEGTDARSFAQVLILKLLVKVNSMIDYIEEAFAGQPFIRGLPPDAPANQRRFDAYWESYLKVTKLLLQLVQLTMVDQNPSANPASRTKKDG